MNSHISQFPIGTYKKAHAHGPGAHVIILSGEGYSLMWPEGDEPQRYDWEVGTMIVPPNMWFHQHFNTGTTPARYLAFKHEVVAIRNAQGVPKAWISKRIGGDQIDYADEKPEIRQMFATELAKHGLTPRMDEAYAQELAELGVEVRRNVCRHSGAPGFSPRAPQSDIHDRRVIDSGPAASRAMPEMTTHSITSSAIDSTAGGTSMPSARAVLRLMANSNLVNCSTGKSAGLTPLRMRPV